MKCPSCASPLGASEWHCPSCGLTVQTLDTKFGAVPRHSMYFTDRTDRVPLRETARIRDALELFHQRFPQCLFSVFVAQLPVGTSIGEYAFWLANRARFGSADEVLGDNFNLLLVLDLSQEVAALTVGYGLEQHLGEEDIRAALEAFAARMSENALPGAVHACVEHVGQRLRERWIRTHTRPAAGEPAQPEQAWT